MNILKCKKGQIFDIGFVNPDVVHEKNLIEEKTYQEVEDILYKSFLYNECRREILFPYNFK